MAAVMVVRELRVSVEEREREAKVGEEVAAMLCGRESVMLPAPFVTATWFAVPLSVAATGKFPALPINN